jgi:DNA-binding NarL/FixJ family response regulator
MVDDNRIRVVIADDHARVRGQIRAALEAGGCEICGEGATAD